MRRVWPDAVVEETNLTVNMSALRKALGESPRERLYLLTVSGRGYQFVADVRYPDDEPTEETKERSQLDGRAVDTGIVSNSRGRNLKISAALILTALAGLAVAALFFWSPKAAPDLRVKTFAVLPFKSLNNNEHDEALALGMADALITNLSNIRQVNVRPTSVVIKYATQKSDPLAAGQELNVDAVLEGSVRRAGDRVRVTVQLFSVREQKPIWADSFEEHFTDIFTLQDSITAKVADALKLVLTDEEAITTLQKALSLPGIYFRSTAQADLAHVYAVSGKRGDALRALNELQELSKESYVSPYDIAVVYAGLGDKEQALTSLYKAYEDRSRWLVWLKVDPRLDVLRPDSRFVELQRRMGLAH